MAKRIYEIEQAFKDRFINITVSNLEGGAPLPIQVFVENPDIEEVPNRVYPAVSINLIGMEFDPTMEGHEPERSVLSVNQATGEIITRRSSHWYRLSYQVHAWSLYAKQDRDLVRRIEAINEPRDALTVVDESYWLFRQSFDTLDEIELDRTIYHKVWTYEVLADIDNTDTDQTDKIVEEIHIRSHSIKTRSDNGRIKPVDGSGNFTTAINAERVLHREIRYDDQKYWFNP